MDIEDDATFLENLFNNTNLMDNAHDPKLPGDNRLNPNAPIFIPGNGGDENNPNLGPPNDGVDQVRKLPLVDLGDNPNDDRMEEMDDGQGPANLGILNVGVRQNHGDDRNADVTRERLQNIIRASENRSARARQAFQKLYGQNQDVNDRGPNNRGYDQRNMMRQNNERGIRDYPTGNRYNQDRNLNANVNDYGNRFDEGRGQGYGYHRQERDFDTNSQLGPIRSRRGGRNQDERDAAYWRGKFFQLRSQSKKVKEFFFHDKY